MYGICPLNLDTERKLSWEHNENLKREENKWRQKSIVRWLVASDLNIKFFHLTTIVRRRKSFIDIMKKGNGAWLNGSEQIGGCFA